MFLCSDMDSPQKTGLDTSQTIPFGEDHPTLISATIIDLAILRACGENFMSLYTDLDSLGKMGPDTS